MLYGCSQSEPQTGQSPPPATTGGGGNASPATASAASPTTSKAAGTPGAVATVGPDGNPLPGLADWKDKKDPVPNNAQALAQGKEIFMKNCSPCHGPEGKGDGPQGLALDPKPRNMTDAAEFQYGMQDWQIFRTAWEGIPSTGMAPWKGRLSEKDIWTVVHYVKSLSNTK